MWIWKRNWFSLKWIKKWPNLLLLVHRVNKLIYEDWNLWWVILIIITVLGKLTKSIGTWKCVLINSTNALTPKYGHIKKRKSGMRLTPRSVWYLVCIVHFSMIKTWFPSDKYIKLLSGKKYFFCLPQAISHLKLFKISEKLWL